MSDQKKVVSFFILFLSVYFLESIGGFYMASAVVSIEKQFKIPSRLSGLMVSAGDFGYIPSVVFVSYLGGKGNRARWIGAGCLMIAFANFLISMSNFLFPVKTTQLSSTFVESRLVNDFGRLTDAIKFSTFLEYTRNSSSSSSLQELNRVLEAVPLNTTLRQFANEKLSSCHQYNRSSNQLCRIFLEFLYHSNRPNETEISNMRILSGSVFAFCNKMFNSLRREIEAIRCARGSSNTGPFITIFGGLLILGIGRTMPYSLGLPLIDDNVKQQNLPLYFAIMFLIRIFGPVLGFFIGSIANNYYYSFDVPSGLTPRDPLWIGRWWAGFLGIAIAMFGPSLALYLYPTCTNYKPADLDEENNDNAANDLGDCTAHEIHPLVNKNRSAKGANKPRSKGLALIDRHAVKDEAGNTVVPDSLKEKIMDFITTVQTIMKTPVFVASMFGRIVDVFAMKGFFVFLPKYLEVQFGVPQHKISLYMGVVILLGFMVGVLIGSIIMRRFKLQGRKAAAYIVICSLIGALVAFFNSTVSCKSALTLVSDKFKSANENFTTTCATGCDCNGVPLYPVCNRKGQAFYSPCHAGCPLDQSFANSSIRKAFQNCECSGSTDLEVSRDFCDQSVCEAKFLRYFVNLAILGIFDGMCTTPAVVIVLRSVPPVDRSISLGFQGFLVSLLATLPSPVFWGWIVDKSCVLWNNVCGEKSRGACALYNADKLRLTTHLTYACMRLLSLIPDILVFYFAKGLILAEDEPTERNPFASIPSLVIDGITDKKNYLRKPSHFASVPNLITNIRVNRHRNGGSM